jgi:hypothetical protein
MAGIHKFSGSFSHSGSTPAQFKSGIASNDIVTGNFFGDGSGLSNLNFGISGVSLFFGSESIGTPNTYGNWIKSGEGNQTIVLSTSGSNGAFNHFTFLKLDDTNGWIEVSDYDKTQNGLASNTTLSQTLGTGVYEYLLLAMSTASKETVTAGATVIINPDEL